MILVGHSIAGDELTKFAGLYPSRVRALVYLDAAYDRTKVEDLPPPPYPEPSTDTYASVEKFTAYLARVWNWRAPEAETYNTRTVAPDGRVGAMKTSPKIPAEIIKRIEVPDYGRLKAPALALTPSPTCRPFILTAPTLTRARAHGQNALSLLLRSTSRSLLRDFWQRPTTGKSWFLRVITTSF